MEGNAKFQLGVSKNKDGILSHPNSWSPNPTHGLTAEGPQDQDKRG